MHHGDYFQWLSLASTMLVLEASLRELRSWVPWEYLYADDLVIDESLKEYVRRLLTWKAAIEEKELTIKCSTNSKCRKDKDHDLYSMGWTSCRVQASFHALSVALEWAATASSEMAASTR